ncbi:PorV/PorQ family protein [bacterium]|nr:PorV/PorQ family protein [bacterium]
MKRLTLYMTLVVLMLITVLGSTVLADRSRAGVLFLLIGPGARPTGMGEAFSAIADDATATYWNPAGLGLYPLSSKWYDFKAPNGESITAMGLTKGSLFQQGYKKHQLWIATDENLYYLDKEEWKDHEEYVTIEGETLMDIIKSYLTPGKIDTMEIIRSIGPKVIEFNNLNVVDNENVRAFGINDSLPSDIKLKIPFFAFISDKITSLCISEGKTIWVGSEKGLYKYKDYWEKVSENDGPGDNYINDVIEDEGGGLWVCTKKGLFIKRGGKWYKYTTSEGIPGTEIDELFVISPYKAWVSSGRNVAFFDGKQWNREYSYTIKPGATWLEIASDIFPVKSNRKKELIAAELMAANNVQDPEFTQSPVSDKIVVPYRLAFEGTVNSIYADNKTGNTWFGSEYGIKRFDGQVWNFYGFSEEKINSNTTFLDWVKSKWSDLTHTAQEELAEKIRIYNQLNEQNIDAQTIIEYPASPASANINEIIEGPSRKIIIGSEYGTLVYKESEDNFKYYDQSGLHEKEALKIVSMGKDFWFQFDDEIKIYTKGNKELTFMHVQWLPTLADDIYYEFFSSTYYLEGWGTLGGSIIFISEGENIWTDESGNVLGTFQSYELAVGLSYGTAILDKLALGLNFKVIHSHLVPRQVTVGGEQGEGVATVFAVDGGLHYQLPLKGLTMGLTVQNIGPSIHYIDYEQRDPLPRNLKLGLAYRILDSDFNRLTIATDFNKDLIDLGNDPLNRELREMVKNIGVEYTYSNLISLRGGYLIDYDYHYEPGDDEWVGTHYMTFGAGIKYSNYQFDFSYVPEHTGADESTLPLSNIMRFSLLARF